MFTADPRYLSSVKVTLLYVGVSVPLLLVVSMILALLLNKGIEFSSGYRALFYLPSLMGASVAIAVLWRQIFGSAGLVNQVLALFGITPRQLGRQSWYGVVDDRDAEPLGVRRER